MFSCFCEALLGPLGRLFAWFRVVAYDLVQHAIISFVYPPSMGEGLFSGHGGSLGGGGSVQHIFPFVRHPDMGDGPLEISAT